MPVELVPWIMLPVVGAIIGYATNWLAIQMLFHPRKPIWGVQGLLPRRQQDFAEKVGEVVANDLVKADRLLEPLGELDLRPQVADLLDQVIADKLTDLQKIPLIGSMIKPELLGGIKDAVLSEVDRRQPKIKEALVGQLVDRIDIAGLARNEIAQFDLADLERTVRRVAKHEFAAITWWGAVLGAMIGLIQAVCLHLLPAAA